MTRLARLDPRLPGAQRLRGAKRQKDVTQKGKLGAGVALGQLRGRTRRGRRDGLVYVGHKDCRIFMDI